MISVPPAEAGRSRAIYLNLRLLKRQAKVFICPRQRQFPGDMIPREVTEYQTLSYDLIPEKDLDHVQFTMYLIWQNW